MSFEAVFDSYSRIERHMKEFPIEVPYNYTLARLNNMRALFLQWLELYKEYAKGYSQELLTRSSLPTIRMLSFDGIVLEDKFSGIFGAKIPWEAYILLDEFFRELGHAGSYALAEGDFFEQTTVHDEALRALGKLTPPGPQREQSRIGVLKTGIKTKNMTIIYYERGQYDNPLSWPLLLHEGLHQMYTLEGLQRLQDKCPAVPWCQEALIDIYAINFFGPAYALSSAAYLQRFPYLKTRSHADFCARLYVSLLYLTELIDNNDQMPSPMSEHIAKTFDYVKEVWNRYQRYAPDVQNIVENIYGSTKSDVRKIMGKKTKTFVDLLSKIEEDRRRASTLTGSEYLRNEVLSIDDVLDYYRKGLPIAANCRILFNSFVSEPYFRTGPNSVFITESLKKWYLKQMWIRTEKT